MKIDIKRLVVKYNKKIVGFLEELSNGEIAFQYDKEWVNNGFSISPFYLPLTDQVFISNSDYFSGLFGVFHDSLPDSWGNYWSVECLLKKSINFDKISVLTRLSLVIDNGLGALTYEPTQSKKSGDKISDLDAIDKEVNHIFDNHTETNHFDLIYDLGGASGGARPKVHVVINNENWIVKFPSSLDPKGIGKLEYHANEYARRLGINVNDFHLFPSKKCSGYFGAKRFERQKGKKMHMISLASLLETTHRIPNLDYSHLFQVIQKICVDQKDIYEAYRRMCFNVLYQNKDDYGKKFAFLYDENLNGYKLSPFYDITQTKDKMEHEMTVLGDGTPTKSKLLDIAREFNLSLKTCHSIINSIKNYSLKTY